MSHAIEAKLAKAYTAAGGRNVGAFPWASILELILGMLGGCKLPVVQQRWAKRHPEAAKEALHDKYKEMGAFTSTIDRTAAVEAAYETFITMTPAELRALRDDPEEE